MNIRTACVYVCASVTSCLFVCSTVTSLIPWLSSQTLRHGESDALVLDRHRVMVDVLLVLVFIAQHGLMATKAYKKLFKSFGDMALERLVYNLATAFSLKIMMSKWQPISMYSLWKLETYQGGLLWLAICCLHTFLWLCQFFLALSFDPVELLGLKQVWCALNDWKPPLFYTNKYLRRLYRQLRHPGMLCFVSILWLYPIMSLDRFVLAAALSAFVFCGHGVMDAEHMYISLAMEGMKKPDSHCSETEVEEVQD